MRSVIQYGPREVRDGREAVLARMAMTLGDVSVRLERLFEQAEQRLDEIAAPVAVFHSLSSDECLRIFDGDGMNALATPLGEILPRATAVATFAGTLGPALDEEIRALFERGDPALAYVLDATAGCAAERLADLTARRFVRAIRGGPEIRALAYSPGYCGWHVSGQRALFEHLRPVDLGIGLTASCLMDPVKSVSGVLVAGLPPIHTFRPTYPFCTACESKMCRARIAGVRAPQRP